MLQRQTGVQSLQTWRRAGKRQHFTLCTLKAAAAFTGIMSFLIFYCILKSLIYRNCSDRYRLNHILENYEHKRNNLIVSFLWVFGVFFAFQAQNLLLGSLWSKQSSLTYVIKAALLAACCSCHGNPNASSPYCLDRSIPWKLFFFYLTESWCIKAAVRGGLVQVVGVLQNRGSCMDSWNNASVFYMTYSFIYFFVNVWSSLAWPSWRMQTEMMLCDHREAGNGNDGPKYYYLFIWKQMKWCKKYLKIQISISKNTFNFHNI